MVLSIGGCHGDDRKDKISQLGVQMCYPGWRKVSTLCNDPTAPGSSTAESSRRPPKGSRKEKKWLKLQELQGIVSRTIAVQECAAHIVCRKVSTQDLQQGHNLLHCKMLCAYVRPAYWSGNMFQPESSNVPPYLTFF